MPALSAEDANAPRRPAGVEDRIRRAGEDFPIQGFRAALEFVNQVGELAEEAGHHPDIDIRYNRVRLGLMTHDAGGLTAEGLRSGRSGGQACLTG